YGAMGVRNFAVSGLPLPATFYAKAGMPRVQLVGAEVRGFSELIGRFPVVDSSILLLASALLAPWILARPPSAATPLDYASAALLAGLSFCAASFALIAPDDPRAFYHQRYVLPALPLMVAAIPVLLSRGIPRRLGGGPRALVQVAVLAL